MHHREASARHAGARSGSLAFVTALFATALMATPAAAHGPTPAAPPDASSLLLGWTFEPMPTLSILAALIWWRWAVSRVNAAHRANPVPRSRTVAFVAGMAALAAALLSGIDRYDTSLFSIHMVQHVLLTLVAAPLIALAAPITLLLRVASPGTRRRVILPVLHARVTRILAFPVVAWLLFAAVMWVSHFSPLFDAALEDPLIHDLEHVAFLGAALLFWWPAVGLDPGPWRMSHPVRALYVFLQMSQNTLLAVVIVNAQTVLYPHYATIERAWGPTPLADQQMAGGFMWVAGDLLFLTATMAILVGWSRAEARDAARADRRAATELAEIRIREGRLADRLAQERGEAEPDDRALDAQPGSGASR
jgi:cytochrome c oxidase assembly factor CtaG